jgi:RHS repeat-associated protein
VKKKNLFQSTCDKSKNVEDLGHGCQQTQVKNATNDIIGTYEYDGTGARVKKITALETTIFVYNAGGKLLAEYSTQTASNPTISYLTNDNLGSPRVITDNGGNVSSRRDFMPFGEDLNVGVGGRSATNKYSATTDNIRQKFTGYEKDDETGLDFAEARYYNNLHGRFTAVDPMLASGRSADPQSFNRYAYVSNNPVNVTDPSGMIWSSSGFGFDAFSFADDGGTWDIKKYEIPDGKDSRVRTDFVSKDTGRITNINDGIDQTIARTDEQINQSLFLFATNRPAYNNSLGPIERSSDNLHMTRAQFYSFVSATYAETSGGYDETFGIVNVLENRADFDGNSVLDQQNATGQMNGTNSDLYAKEALTVAGVTKANTVRRAIANALTTDDDKTNGAYFWDGRDFNKNARGNNSGWRLRHQSGYFFTNPSHDLYKQGSVKSKKFGYYYESTAAIGATTFSRRFEYNGGNWR